jgi:hypothetical protein
MMFEKIASSVVSLIGKVHWKPLAIFFKGRYYDLTPEDHRTLRSLLTKDYFIILTRRKVNLSTYAINFSHFFLTGKWGYYSHSLMNLEDAVHSESDFRLIEATNKRGVGYAPFDKVFDCDSVVLLKPKGIALYEWTAILDNLKTHKGKKYDTLYDLTDATEMSCVELVRTALMTLPNYEKRFARFEKMIAKAKNLDPHMFYRCGDFEIVHEVRR